MNYMKLNWVLRRETLDGTVDFIGSVMTVNFTIAIFADLDALTVGTTPFQCAIAP